MKEKKQGKARRVRWVLPALAVLTAAGWLGNCTLVTAPYRLESTRLPAAFSGLRIAQLSDLHGARFGKDNARLLDAVRRAQPDLIALTGDLADEVAGLDGLPQLLAQLRAIAPVFYVTGNHEWVCTREMRQALFDMLDSADVVRLRNSYRVLTCGDARMVVAGVDDPNGPADQKTPETLVREIREREGEDVYILMLAHRNDQLERWAALGVDAVLSGHAHGGIVRLPVIGPIFGTHYEFFPEYTAGVYAQGRTQLVVSRGLGPSHRLPLRVCNPPELPVVTLVRDDP